MQNSYLYVNHYSSCSSGPTDQTVDIDGTEKTITVPGSSARITLTGKKSIVRWFLVLLCTTSPLVTHSFLLDPLQSMSGFPHPFFKSILDPFKD